MPSFDLQDGKFPILINDRSLPQCPTGYLQNDIGREALSWVDEFYRMKSITKSSNSPYFQSVDNADPRTVSAFALIESENKHISNEITEQISQRPR